VRDPVQKYIVKQIVDTEDRRLSSNSLENIKQTTGKRQLESREQRAWSRGQ
jgi:hypothetical protein